MPRAADTRPIHVLRELLTHRGTLRATASRLAPAAAGRAWELVRDADDYNAWLIAWSADSALTAHDHGSSDAAVHVLRGSLIEWYHDPGDRALWNVRELGAGRSITVPRARIHEVHNAARDAALSLHVYSPPLTAMNAYGAVGRSTVGSAAASL
jgi:hypothetical protein